MCFEQKLSEGRIKKKSFLKTIGRAVEGGTTRGTIALVYYWIYSLYTGTVQG
jgi:hypothetical protein